MFWSREILEAALHAESSRNIDPTDPQQLQQFCADQGYVGGAGGSRANVDAAIQQTSQEHSAPPRLARDFSSVQIKAIWAFRSGNYQDENGVQRSRYDGSGAEIRDFQFPATEKYEVTLRRPFCFYLFLRILNRLSWFCFLFFSCFRQRFRIKDLHLWLVTEETPVDFVTAPYNLVYVKTRANGSRHALVVVSPEDDRLVIDWVTHVLMTTVAVPSWAIVMQFLKTHVRLNALSFKDRNHTTVSEIIRTAIFIKSTRNHPSGLAQHELIHMNDQRRVIRMEGMTTTGFSELTGRLDGLQQGFNQQGERYERMHSTTLQSHEQQHSAALRSHEERHNAALQSHEQQCRELMAHQERVIGMLLGGTPNTAPRSYPHPAFTAPRPAFHQTQSFRYPKPPDSRRHPRFENRSDESFASRAPYPHTVAGAQRVSKNAEMSEWAQQWSGVMNPATSQDSPILDRGQVHVPASARPDVPVRDSPGAVQPRNPASLFGDDVTTPTECDDVRAVPVVTEPRDARHGSEDGKPHAKSPAPTRAPSETLPTEQQTRVTSPTPASSVAGRSSFGSTVTGVASQDGISSPAARRRWASRHSFPKSVSADTRSTGDTASPAPSGKTGSPTKSDSDATVPTSVGRRSVESARTTTTSSENPTSVDDSPGTASAMTEYLPSSPESQIGSDDAGNFFPLTRGKKACMRCIKKWEVSREFCYQHKTGQPLS